MKAERCVFISAFIAIMLTATDAFADGDPGAVFFMFAAFAVYQLLFAAVMFVSGQPMKRRIKFAKYYVISCMASFVFAIMLDNVLNGPVLEYALFVLPMGLLITFRYFLSHPPSDRARRADAG